MQCNFILRISPSREIFSCHNLACCSLAMSGIRSKITFWSFGGVDLLLVSQFMLIDCRCSTQSSPPSLSMAQGYSLGSCDRCIGPEYNSFSNHRRNKLIDVQAVIGPRCRKPRYAEVALVVVNFVTMKMSKIYKD